MRCGFISVFTATHIALDCGHPQTHMHNGKWAFIHWKWVYGVPCLIGESSTQSSTWRLLLKHIGRSSLILSPFSNTVKLMPGSDETRYIRIPHGKPRNFFNHFFCWWIDFLWFVASMHSRLVPFGLLFVRSLWEEGVQNFPCHYRWIKSTNHWRNNKIDSSALKNLFSNLMKHCQVYSDWCASFSAVLVMFNVNIVSQAFP